MQSRALLTLFVLAACHEDRIQQALGFPPLPAESTGSLTEAPTSSTSASEAPTTEASGSAETTTVADAGTGSEPSTGGDASLPPPLPPPEIHALDMPAKISAAGPVDVVVHADATTVRGVLDDGEIILFNNDGDEDGDGVSVFSAVLSIYGSVDNGGHTLEAIAERGGLADSMTHPFEVAAPAAGLIAWGHHGGPGSRTHRLALDAEGTVFESGALDIGGTERPAVRKRDPINGANLWPGGWRTVDNREGWIADLVVTPDGRLWVAMNVRAGNNTWSARITLLEADLQPTGIELETPGAVSAIADDGDGGYFGAGYATTFYGDTDVLLFRSSGDGKSVVSGHPWDYVPPMKDAHKFVDLAFDVVVDEQAGEAWIVGASQGTHDGWNLEARGMLVRVDLDTLDVLDPVIIAPKIGAMTQSMFYGGALDPAGIVVVGNECTKDCSSQRATAYRYGAGGVGTVIYSGGATSVAFGSSIARNAHGAVLIAVNVKVGPTMHGSLLGFRDGVELFAPLEFPGKGASETSSVAVGPYDWAFAGGRATLNGAPQAYVMRPHQ